MKKMLLKLGVLSTFVLSSCNSWARELVFDAEGTKKFTSIPFIDQEWFQEKFPAWANFINNLEFDDPYMPNIPKGFYFNRKGDFYSSELVSALEGWQNIKKYTPPFDPEFRAGYKLSTGKELGELSAFDIHKLDQQYYIDLYRQAFKRQIDSLSIERLEIKNYCYHSPDIYIDLRYYMDSCKPNSDRVSDRFDESNYDFNNQTYKLALRNIPVENVLFNTISNKGETIGELFISLPIDIAEKISKSTDLTTYLSYTLVNGVPWADSRMDWFGGGYGYGMFVSGTNFETIKDISVLFIWDDDKKSYRSDNVSFQARLPQ